MPRLSKFDLMRNNREVAACRIHYARAVDAAQPVHAAVPTMEIDGVKYREAPDTGSGCDGCAFDAGCRASYRDAADKAFGGRCSRRGVIYIRAEG